MMPITKHAAFISRWAPGIERADLRARFEQELAELVSRCEEKGAEMPLKVAMRETVELNALMDTISELGVARGEIARLQQRVVELEECQRWIPFDERLPVVPEDCRRQIIVAARTGLFGEFWITPVFMDVSHCLAVDESVRRHKSEHPFLFWKPALKMPSETREP